MTSVADAMCALTTEYEFHKLKEIGDQFDKNAAEFNIVSVFSDLLDENAWSRILAYLMDSSHPHQLQKDFIALLLQGHIDPRVQRFMRDLISDPNIRTTVITEWRTQNNRRVDILVKFLNLDYQVKAVIAFENKLYTPEHNLQIQDYQKSLHLYFPEASKFIFFLNPFRMESKTALKDEKCACYSLSYEDIVHVCEQLSAKTSGQIQALLLALKQFLANTFKYNRMDNEIKNLVYQLYQKPELRTAMEMIALHIPNINHVFDALDTHFTNKEVEELSKTKVPDENRVAFRYQHKEYKIHIRELDVYTNEYGIYPTYILCLEGNSLPKIGSRYTLRLMVHVEIFAHNEQTALLRQEAIKRLGLSNSKGEPKHYWQWVNIWVGDSYALDDLGNNDALGLINIVEKGIMETIGELKNKMSDYRLKVS